MKQSTVGMKFPPLVNCGPSRVQHGFPWSLSTGADAELVLESRRSPVIRNLPLCSGETFVRYSSPTLLCLILSDR